MDRKPYFWWRVFSLLSRDSLLSCLVSPLPEGLDSGHIFLLQHRIFHRNSKYSFQFFPGLDSGDRLIMIILSQRFPVLSPRNQTWDNILKNFEKSKFWSYWYWFWYWKLQFQNIDFDIDIEICISKILILILILNFLGILILILVLILKKRGKYWKF